MDTNSKPIAIYHEHPLWFRPLFDEFDRRGTNYLRVDAKQHSYDIASPDGEYSLLFNRMSPSAYTRGVGNGIFYTLSYLASLERSGTRVVNGHKAFTYETSKAQQLSLLQQLGVPYPRSRVINHAMQAVQASKGLRFPIVVKANIGGSGVGIVRFDTVAQLSKAAEAGELNLGFDSTALVQEFIPARDGRIMRIEVIGGKFIYGIRVYSSGDIFDLCPADICSTTSGVELVRSVCAVDAPRNSLTVEAYDPSREVISDVERIFAATTIEVGGIESIVDDRDGKLYYYDINALSNFVAEGPRVVGFDPYARLADYLEREALR